MGKAKQAAAAKVHILVTMGDEAQFVGEAVCCGMRFLFEKDPRDPDASKFVNMTYDRHNFPVAKCPRCGALENF